MHDVLLGTVMIHQQIGLLIDFNVSVSDFISLFFAISPFVCGLLKLKKEPVIRILCLFPSFVLLGVKPRAPCLPGKCYNTQIQWPPFDFQFG